MSIQYKVGNLLTDPDINVILHQANIYCTLATRTSSGLAAAIEKMYPEACEADATTAKGDTRKLGTYTMGQNKEGKTVCNCYTQTGMGASDRNTSYNDILVVFKDIEKRCRVFNEKNKNAATNVLGQTKTEKVCGIPYKYGSGLAGGSFLIVNAIIREVFEDSPVKCMVVRLPSESEVKI